MEGEKNLTSIAKLNFQRGVVHSLTQGSVTLPALLIQYYKALGINETEVMLIIHLWTFREKEQITFPTIEEISSRMSVTAEQVIAAIQKLLKLGCLSIDENQDPITKVQYEEYNLAPLLEKLAEYLAEQEEAAIEPDSDKDEELEKENSIFTAFENEFGRPLSPMECETISSWMDQDQYSEPLIRAALKESVFAGKVHFRYIDRILLDWSRNRVRTPDEAKEYAQRFRG